jgi:cytochrome c oxidase subunit 3/cytochrome c oxidase subunit I+III
VTSQVLAETRPPRRKAPAFATRPNGWWGMLLFVATESSLFAVLIATYFYLRFESITWPPHGIDKPKILLPVLLTAVLASTSVPMALAERAIKYGRRRALELWLLLALVLGTGYLFLQLLQFHKDLDKFSPQDNAYASIYYTLTGAHAAHVAAGLLFNLWIQIGAWRGAYRPERYAAVQVTALYWHFVNALAVAVLATAYLSPSL